jgi:ABC-type transporter MlaC component
MASVTSRINGVVPIAVDWQLNPTNNGYKVTNLFVSGINMASMQRSDVISVVQRNSGQMQALLTALREKNASNGILRY